jgi:cytochrome c556
MNWRRVTKCLVGIVAAGVIGTSGLAVAQGDAFREAMGRNLVGLQRILIGLVNMDYRGITPDIEMIRAHASQLTQELADRPKADRDQMRAYAYNLEGNAKNLKSTVELLIQHDKERAARGELAPDHLRDVAAAYYGGTVSMCVACHNRFRVPFGQ